MNIFLYVKRSIILIICCGWLILTGCTNEQYTISAQGFAIDDDPELFIDNLRFTYNVDASSI